MNYSEALRSAAALFREAGIEDADTDAGLLLNHVTGRDRTFFLAHGEELLTEREERQFELLTEKRARRIPLQHLTGVMDFMGLSFRVSRDALIPRIDTEFLVEEAMTEVMDGERVLDLCTGSGCVLLSLMRYKNDIEGVGTDISGEALSLARENAESLGITGARFLQGDMFAALPSGRPFDAILCNPPYIRTAEIDTLMEEVRVHEPRIALDGGEDGLHFYRILAREAAERLVPEGRLFLEIGWNQGEAVRELLLRAGYRDIRVIRDFSGNERVVRCRK